ncbi:hypothetical protein [Actinacidiphila alni]|uniref:hypothetical protein n=1 Tax=Actinacidiphila alni TaxID=380248 RepID=UPI003453E467
MEFSRSGRLRGSGRRWVAGGTLTAAGAVVWAVLTRGESRQTAFICLGMAALAVLAGFRSLRKARLPFRLRIDEYGVTLHDTRLDWGQIEGVGLRYGPADADSAPPAPELVVYPAAGVVLTGTPRRYVAGRTAYLLIDGAEVDQGLGALIDALKRYAGPRFEGAPRQYRPAAAPGAPGPLVPGFGPVSDAAGPFGPVDAGPAVAGRTFAPRRTAGGPLLAALAGCALGAFATYRMISGGPLSGAQQALVLGPLFAVGGLYGSFWLFRRWLRPLRLRIGPDGIAMRDFAATELVFGWNRIAAVTVGPRPSGTGGRPWLLVWPVPGESFPLPRTDVVDGHETYALVELRRLRDPADVEPVTRHFAGRRYAEPL